MADNSLRHYYLYAKHHYYSSDIIEDLKKIHANWCGFDSQLVDVADVVHKLLELVFVHINKDHVYGYRSFIEFINDISPDDNWKVGGQKGDDYWMRVIKKCLSILRLTKSSEFPFDIGLPDGNILPLKNIGTGI